MYTRMRTKDLRSGINYTGTRTDVRRDGVTSVTPSTGRKLLEGQFVETSDVVIPNFLSRRAAGELFFNPFKGTKTVCQMVESGRVAGKRTTPPLPGENGTELSTYSYSNAFCSHGTLALRKAYPLDSLYQPSISKILARNASAADVAWNAALNDVAKTDVLLLVSVFEIKETLALLTKYASLLALRLAPMRDFVYNLRKGRYTAKELTVMVSNQWLEYRYGIMPLVYDIEGVVKAFNRKVDAVRLTARGKTTWEDTDTDSLTFASSGAYPGIVASAVTSVSAKVSAGVLYVPLLQGTAASLGLHISSIPEAMFELTRLSFVANWFMDLGETIRGLTAAVRGDVKGGWITTRLEASTTYLNTWLPPKSTSWSYGGVTYPVDWTITDALATQLTVSESTTIRTPVSGSLPRSPSIRLQMSPKRVADAFALVASSFLDISNHRKTARL